jgi:hypothetical protein
MAALNPLQFKGLAPGQLLPPGSGGYNAGIPGYATSATTNSQSGIPELRPKVVSTLDTALSGGLPQDVVDQMRQHAAEFGVASGMPGSEFSGYQGLRNLGLTSLSQINRAQDLLAPGYRESTSYSGNPQGGPSSHTSNWNVGSVPGTLQRGGGGAAPAPAGQPGKPDNQSLVGDFLAKYLPGSRGGGTSTGMAPMGSTPQDLRLAIPGFGTGLNISQQNWGQQPVSSGSMYMGPDNGLDQSWFEDQLAGDPLSDFNGSFTGDINYDYGDFEYA